MMSMIDPRKVHPIEYRYGCEELRRIFSVENFYRTMAMVELAVVEKQEKHGIVPDGTSGALRRAIEKLDVNDIFEEEKITRHDIMALINVLARHMGELGEYIHIGLTSADLRDTAKVLILREALDHIESKLKLLIKCLGELASRYIDLPCVARTHGMHASIYTLGRKFAVFADEFLRHIERIHDARKRIFVGKISGSVGIHSSLGEVGEIVEREVLEELGLGVDESATQIISRDRFAEIFLLMSLISSSLEKLATEIRNLQRTEISELEEQFLSSQVGSTAMPHKRNPISSENICSIARVVRGLAIAALENIVLWHERDLTNSASERIIIPEIFMLVDEQISRAIKILRNLKINIKNIERNIKFTGGMIYSDILVTRLAMRGLGRQNAHELVRRIAMEAYESGRNFIELVLSNDTIRKYLTEEEIREIFRPDPHIKVAVKRVEKTLAKIKKKNEVEI